MYECRSKNRPRDAALAASRGGVKVDHRQILASRTRCAVRGDGFAAIEGFWCKYVREAQQGPRMGGDYAARTAFQIAGAVWVLK